MKILIADKVHPSAISDLEKLGHEVTSNPGCTSDDLHEHLADVEVLVVRSTRVVADAISKANSLELIIRAGAGTDTIDVEAASSQGIYVCNIPGRNAVAVAELTFGLLLAIDRRIADGVIDLRDGVWNKRLYSKAEGLQGKTMGIIGLGDIGLSVAERAKAFGIKVIGQRKSGRTPQAEQKIRQIGIKLVDTKEELVSQSHIVSVHVPYNNETHALINHDLLQHFMDDAILINTSRGEIVDEEAVLDAINQRGLKAGLDVFRDEPSKGEGSFHSQIASNLSVVGSHHIGASTTQASKAIAQGILDAITGFEQGSPINCVNQSPAGDGTSQVRVRHLDRVGVLASVLSSLRAAELNVQYMDNKVFAGKNAAVSTIEVAGEIPSDLYKNLLALDNVLGVSLLDQRNAKSV
tara:strand:- start:11480 stop:12703 length:1224 start_codon:yes stop_codon:yes gene_type:complete